MSKDYAYEYPRPSATATVLVINTDTSEPVVLVGQRSYEADAYPGFFCLPGGFLNARVNPEDGAVHPLEFRPGETLGEAACRELEEEVGLAAQPYWLELFAEYSHPALDPRAHVINACYMLKMQNRGLQNLKAGDDLIALHWMNLKTALNTNNWAFNHLEILIQGIEKYEIDKSRIESLHTLGMTRTIIQSNPLLRMLYNRQMKKLIRDDKQNPYLIKKEVQ